MKLPMHSEVNAISGAEKPWSGIF